MKAFHCVAVSTLVLVAACLAVSSVAAAEPQQVPTVVTVKKLCPTCGKKIVQKLSELPQVAEATMNVEQRTLRVRCVPGGSVSPRDVWKPLNVAENSPSKFSAQWARLRQSPSSR